MKKFAVFSGFLGSGKTTTMMALTSPGSGAAMITNDLGGKGLADHRLAKLHQCNASEITGDCICYQTETLVARLEQLFDQEGIELVISDIPGFGVGALDHVYHTLHNDYPQYVLAPFTVLTEPRTISMLQTDGGGDLGYILHTQLVEADLIVLNKCDQLTAEETTTALRWLRSAYPHAEVLAISAATGEGLDALRQALLKGQASLHRPDIGYGGEAFTQVMSKVCEYNLQYHATVCCNDFDGNAYLLELAEAIGAGVAALDAHIPHLKLLAWTPDGDYGKVDLLDTDRPVEVNHIFAQPCTELAVVLNTSAFCPIAQLDALMMQAVKQISDRYQLSLMIFKKEQI